MLSRNRIMERLDLINASVARMQRFAGMSYDDFVADLSGEHKSIARGLGDLGVVDRAMSDTLVMMAGYRNRLVHLYHLVSDRELLDIVSENMSDLTRFVAQVDDYLRGVGRS